ncbi:MAG: queuosine precursor transporter [Bacteroidia bacterium]|nr:queuosine precursor transporter [Bacteroidia bacterium]
MIQSQEHFSKRTNLFVFLSCLFLSTAIIAEIIGGKLFSLEALLGLQPAKIPLFGTMQDFSLSAGVLIWPIVFVMTDIINEYFGRKGVRKISWMAAFFILLAFLFLFLATSLPPSQEKWLNPYKFTGPYEIYKNVNPSCLPSSACPPYLPFDISFAFNTIFRQGLIMIIASLTAFIVGQLIDAYVFYLLKKKWSHSRNIWIRATGSNLVSQLIDSFLVLFLAFYVFGKLTFVDVIAIGIIQYTYKILVSVILLPVLYIGHKVINRYLGNELAEHMLHEDIGGKKEITTGKS